MRQGGEEGDDSSGAGRASEVEQASGAGQAGEVEQASGVGQAGEVPTLLRIISGAKYSGVPHKVQVRPFTRLAKPKSVTCRHKNEQLVERRAAGPSRALRCPPRPGHLDIALLVDEKVLGLQVPVDEVQGVQILKGQDDLRRVETGVGLAGGTSQRGCVGEHDHTPTGSNTWGCVPTEQDTPCPANQNVD